MARCLGDCPEKGVTGKQRRVASLGSNMSCIAGFAR